MPHKSHVASAIAWGFVILAGGPIASAPAHADEPAAAADRPPVATPLTAEEDRWLFDAEEGQRFRALPERQLQQVAPRELPPQIRAIQRSMGGSLLEQFNELQPALGGAPWWKPFRSPQAQPERHAPIWPDPSAANARPGMWPNWSSPAAEPNVRPASAEAPAKHPPAPVVALRTTAAELDEAANRLEELELYPHSDALRELAQRFRIDARRAAAAGRHAASPWISPVEPGPPAGQLPPPGPGPAPELAPTPTEAPDPTESPSNSSSIGSDAWNAPSTRAPTPADQTP
jgi:hypothetical protein